MITTPRERRQEYVYCDADTRDITIICTRPTINEPEGSERQADFPGDLFRPRPSLPRRGSLRNPLPYLREPWIHDSRRASPPPHASPSSRPDFPRPGFRPSRARPYSIVGMQSGTAADGAEFGVSCSYLRPQWLGNLLRPWYCVTRSREWSARGCGCWSRWPCGRGRGYWQLREQFRAESVQSLLRLVRRHPSAVRYVRVAHLRPSALRGKILEPE